MTAVNAAKRKIFARLGMDPALPEAKIRFASQSGLSADQQQPLAMAKGLQMSIEIAMEGLFPDIRTKEDLDSFLQVIDDADEQLPTIFRKQMDEIRKEIPRRGGPGREPILNPDKAAKVCDEIARYIRGGYGVKQAIAETSAKSRELIGKKVSPRTLEKAWSKRRFQANNDEITRNKPKRKVK